LTRGLNDIKNNVDEGEFLTFVDKFLRYLEGKNIDLENKITEIRSNCPYTIPFYLQGESETSKNTKDIAVKFKKVTIPTPAKIDYLKHLNF